MKKSHHRLDRDIGLSGLMTAFYYPHTARMAVGIAWVGWYADREDGVYAHQLLEDVQRLLASPLSDQELSALWLAGTFRYFDLERMGIGGRQWLTWVAEICEFRVTWNVGDAPVPQDPPPARRLEEAVLGEIEEVARELEAATAVHSYNAVPGVVPALLRVTAEVDPDLGFRLLLRTMKGFFVPIGPSRRAGYSALARELGLERAVVEDGDFNVRPDLG